MPNPITNASSAVESSTSLNNSDIHDKSAKSFTLPGKPFLLFSSLPYYAYYLIVAMGLFATFRLYNPYIMLFVIYVVIPIVDSYSEDWLNPDREQYKLLEQNSWFSIPLVALTFVENIITIFSIYYISAHTLPWYFYPGAFYILGSFAGHQFLVAHEMFHKRDFFNRTLGTLNMLKNLYLHFYIEHTLGHHKNVATPGDPATSRLGETIFQFLPRSIIGSYVSAWNIEKRRLTKIRQYKTHWVVQNRMIWFTASYLIPFIVSYHFLGLRGLFVYSLVALLSVVMLETINYVEHYGLVRKEIAPGEYEKVNITHSWNAPHRLSNYLLFKLERHSDHHENAYKPYQALSSYDDSPMLPHGYFFCILLAQIPPVWIRMMDRTLKAYKEKRALNKEERRLNRKDTNMVITSYGILFIVLSILTFYANKSYKF